MFCVSSGRVFLVVVQADSVTLEKKKYAKKKEHSKQTPPTNIKPWSNRIGTRGV